MVIIKNEKSFIVCCGKNNRNSIGCLVWQNYNFSPDARLELITEVALFGFAVKFHVPWKKRKDIVKWKYTFQKFDKNKGIHILTKHSGNGGFGSKRNKTLVIWYGQFRFEATVPWTRVASKGLSK
jgi:hypothetical protein